MVNNIANIAFRIGEPLERWTYDLDVSLLKKPNKFRPSELRTIGTLEADFNQQASLHFSKRIMHLNILNMAINRQKDYFSNRMTDINLTIKFICYQKNFH